MKRIKLAGLAAALILLSTSTIQAQNVSIGIRLGTMGPGLELTGALSNKFNARVGGSLFSYERSDRIEDQEIVIQADSDLKLASAQALIDFFPLRRGLRLTTGLIYNNNHVEALVLPLESYTLNEKEFSPQKIGQLKATISHKSSIHPYAGFGFGNSVRPGKRVGFVFDLGVMYTDSPKVTMEGTGMIAPTATEAAELEENLEGIKLYPLISIGFSYRFLGGRPVQP